MNKTTFGVIVVVAAAFLIWGVAPKAVTIFLGLILLFLIMTNFDKYVALYGAKT